MAGQNIPGCKGSSGGSFPISARKSYVTACEPIAACRQPFYVRSSESFHTCLELTVASGVIGDGPPLVLVHGTPFSSQVWRRIAPLLAQRWKVYFFDLIGYGQSQMKAGQDVFVAIQNGLLAALLQTWSIASPEVLPTTLAAPRSCAPIT